MAETTRRASFPHWTPQEVRWGDMDAMGHVNNAAYFTYCESARIAFFRSLGLDDVSASSRHGPAVVSATLDFRHQVHFPASLEVGTRVSKTGRTSFTLEYAIFRTGTDEVVAQGSSVVVWVDYRAGASRPLPEEIKAAVSSE